MAFLRILCWTLLAVLLKKGYPELYVSLLHMNSDLPRVRTRPDCFLRQF